MSITLFDGAVTEELPDAMVMVDELNWSRVEQGVAYGLTGSLLIDVGVRQEGRPIKLQGDAISGWMRRDQCRRLRAWADLPDGVFTLSVFGESYRVAFDQRAGGLKATPIVEFSDPLDSDYYQVTLSFIEISE